MESKLSGNISGNDEKDLTGTIYQKEDLQTTYPNTNEPSFKPITILGSADIHKQFEEQNIDYDWKIKIEDKLLSEFSDTLSYNSAWIETYECKYNMCRVEIKHSEQFQKTLWLDTLFSNVQEATNTSIIGVDRPNATKNNLIFYLLRQNES